MCPDPELASFQGGGEGYDGRKLRTGEFMTHHLDHKWQIPVPK